MIAPPPKSPDTPKSVLVAMSGGVDSSVTALLLKEEGYDVTGVTFNLFKQPNPQHIQDAQKAAQILGIPHIIMHLEEVFQEKIISYFINSYWDGKTPNPCAFCNKLIKFMALENKANELGIFHLATGHYAKLVPDPQGIGQRLSMSADAKKSQEYFLSLIPSQVLDRLIFPLSIYQKPQVREIANTHQMEFFGAKKDSQEICFLQNESYVSFLEKHNSKSADLPEGKIIHEDSKETLATHTGFYQYTVGQRKGLRIGGRDPLYVTRTDPSQNTVFVGSLGELYKKFLRVNILNIYEPLVTGKNYMVKIRYKSESQLSDLLEWNPETQEIWLEAKDTFYAPSMGQIAVLYSGDLVCAAGIIMEYHSENPTL